MSSTIPSDAPPPPQSRLAPRAALGDPKLGRSLREMIRRRVPACEVDDLVQATLADALASPRLPREPEQMRRWVFAIGRNKVADYHRRAGRERPEELCEAESDATPQAVGDLLHWVEKVLPEGEKAHEALRWMLREGDGEKLEAIAAEAHLPAPQVRKRVSRLREHFRERWALELSALALLALVITAATLLLRKHPAPLPEAVDLPAPPPTAPPRPREFDELRQRALESCERQAWRECLAGLDEAKELDPAGDASEVVERARKRAADALEPAPLPAPAPHDSVRPPRPKPTATSSKTPPAPWNLGGSGSSK